jgi:hypothetical protein
MTYIWCARPSTRPGRSQLARECSQVLTPEPKTPEFLTPDNAPVKATPHSGAAKGRP